MLTGDTRDRPKEISDFKTGETRVFLISLKAGGVGLNLTAADTVILYDPWWNPAVEEQAIDRAHRIGQDKPVFVHKLVMAGTIEEKMEEMKERKRDLAESLFDADGAPTLAMTKAISTCCSTRDDRELRGKISSENASKSDQGCGVVSFSRSVSSPSAFIQVAARIYEGSGSNIHFRIF